MSFWNQLVDRFRGGAGEEIDWEALLIEADLGVKLATEWVEEIKDKGLVRAPEKRNCFFARKWKSWCGFRRPCRSSTSPR